MAIDQDEIAKIAELARIQAVSAALDGALLHVVEDADHGFDVLKRSGRTSEDVRDELVRALLDWVGRAVRG